MSKSRSLDHSGKPFGAPKPRLFSKSWRIKHKVFVPKAVKVQRKGL
jgi:hypothetical protein